MTGTNTANLTPPEKATLDPTTLIPLRDCVSLAKVAFRGLLDRFPNMELASSRSEYRSNPVLRGLTSLALQI